MIEWTFDHTAKFYGDRSRQHADLALQKQQRLNVRPPPIATAARQPKKLWTKFDKIPWRGKGKKVVNLYSASSCTTYTSNALFVINQNRRSHSRRVQPANTGWRTGRPGSPVSCTKASPSVTHIMGYYSFNRPRRDGRLSWSCWLTDSGRRTHKVVKQPSIAQDKESPPARTDILTTMLRHQLSLVVRVYSIDF